MNRLSFTEEIPDEAHDIRWVVPRIDGAPLPELVRSAAASRGLQERRRARRSVHSFGFVEIGPSGAPLVEPLLAGGPAVVVLGCGCGNLGCGDLEADIRITDTTVTWADFSPPTEPPLVLEGLGPFVFDADAYRAAVEGLREA
ncbi:hypothetical protein [Blastococcus sp. URHD0036]|uniref:hypothetical protein n=1 Tax=Blastococcus sp. URHD0036 TaxID=1380356 RepID=UPI00068FD78C|nr:hypothetical protein [Blastococcus sp. URHD0036]